MVGRLSFAVRMVRLWKLAFVAQRAEQSVQKVRSDDRGAALKAKCGISFGNGRKECVGGNEDSLLSRRSG